MSAELHETVTEPTNFERTSAREIAKDGSQKMKGPQANSKPPKV